MDPLFYIILDTYDFFEFLLNDAWFIIMSSIIVGTDGTISTSGTRDPFNRTLTIKRS